MCLLTLAAGFQRSVVRSPAGGTWLWLLLNKIAKKKRFPNRPYRIVAVLYPVKVACLRIPKSDTTGGVIGTHLRKIPQPTWTIESWLWEVWVFDRFELSHSMWKHGTISYLNRPLEPPSMVPSNRLLWVDWGVFGGRLDFVVLEWFLIKFKLIFFI